MAIEIRPVRTRRDMKAFNQAAVRAQGANPHWVQPLDMEAHEFFEHSPFAKENEMQCFIALRDGEVIGRIAAIVNKAHLAKHKDETGHFGFIEAIDEPEVFASLFEEAGRYLKARGMKRIMGPFNPSVNYDAGLLIEGFDQLHMMRTNYAPPYYRKQLEALGFSKAMDLVAFKMDPLDEEVREPLRRIHANLAAWKHRDELKTYGLTHLSWVGSFKRLLALYNDAWEGNWGAVPISDREADFIAKLMLPVVKPSWVRIAQWHGEPVAVVAQIPNTNEAFAKLKGKLLPFGWARLMHHIHIAGTRSSRIPIAGIAQKWRNKRVGQIAMARLMMEAAEIARKNLINHVEMSWVLETNVEAIHGIELFCTRRIRKFRIFERPL